MQRAGLAQVRAADFQRAHTEPFDPDQSASRPMSCIVAAPDKPHGASPMSLETIVGMVAVTVPFVIFAVVLYWAELQTRSH
jgi:hypothetical protein